MVKNASLKEIGEILLGADRVLILPHENPDGDALGSAIALCKGMRTKGKTSYVLVDEAIPEYISFIDRGFTTTDKACMEGDYISVCVDSGEEKRISARIDQFNAGSVRLCLDHHATSGSFGDYYYIDAGEAATCQIIYKLLVAMECPIDMEVAEALYTGISTDTGSFQHSNTTWETHEIAAQLLKTGIDANAIAVRLYQNVSIGKMRLQAMAFNNMDVFAGGRGAISYISNEDIELAGATDDDMEGIIDFIKSVDGVEIAAFVKERSNGIKVSMRAKTNGRVDEIAMKFGGGGHLKAAGCSMDMSIEEAVSAIKTEITKSLEK